MLGQVGKTDVRPAVAIAITERRAGCPVDGKNCAGCYLAKIEVPGMHHSFADHRIRIVRLGEPIPD
jgi:hypothetical protein